MFGLPEKITHMEAYANNFDQVVYLGSHAYYAREEPDGCAVLYPIEPFDAVYLIACDFIDRFVNPLITTLSFEPITFQLNWGYDIAEILEEQVAMIQKALNRGDQ